MMSEPNDNGAGGGSAPTTGTTGTTPTTGTTSTAGVTGRQFLYIIGAVIALVLFAALLHRH